ncbi:type 1 fimbrial protein [Klebsiella huaxiensis]|uniref:Fimbrial protein n=1 Tax=Klebsiella huaxiensis TaxID=2153354 RepID=A0A564MKH2_9ENTR|nr:fimbrial protein [Klebsiella huaxiensis]MDG1643054.1 fimbrial protein [Klebsiella huaxiensis]QBG08528.1 type 1 fimbrial protein [Klebsiella huaxiensis]VUS67395.1 Major fimbrial subunit SMF-1 [Klebsiella huaxiensis]VUS94254.1 Major fimbrial subunit SMF-1 [Klebsiella huaxiensis]VUT13529.1 Major fimbrial subunit SMF-1 [Klebsiella huaxiensis]
MQKSITKLSLAVVLGLGMTSVQAASTGTITFNGELTDTTCEVDIEGQGADATITLPTVGVNDLAVAGAVTGRTAFNMNLSRCSVGTAGGHAKVATFFQPGVSVDLGTGRLKNMSGTATKATLQLLDPSNSYAVINVGNTDQVTRTAYVDIDSSAGAGNGVAQLPYAVEYYAEGITTPGTVSSTVVYNLMYK